MKTFDPFVSKTAPTRWSPAIRRYSVLCGVLGLMGTLQGAAHAAVFTFTGATSSDIELAANYSNNAVPADSLTTDTITVSATATNQPALTKNRSIAGITFSNTTGASSLSGAFTLGVGTGGVTNSTLTTGTTTVSANITQGASQTWAIGGTTGQFIVNGVLDYGAFRLLKNGSGVLVLNGANTGAGLATNIGNVNYTNTFRIDAGVIEVGSASAFGTSTGTTTSGVVDIRAVTLRANKSLTLPNIFVDASGSPTIGGTNNIVLSGGYILNQAVNSQTLAVSNTGTTTISGPVSLTDLSTDATQTLTVNVTGGATTISGVVQNLAGGGAATNPQALAKSGAGTLNLTAANTFTGGTSISAGVLNINADAALGAVPASATTNLTFAGSATLQAGANNIALNANRSIAINSGTSTVDVGANAMTINGVISGAGSLTKISAGTLTLTGTNTYTGGTTIGAGAVASVLRAAASGALGTGTITLDPTGNGSTARLELIGGITLPNAIGFTARNGTSVGIENISGDNTLSGLMTLGTGGNNYTIQSDTGSLALTNTGTSTVTNGKTLALQGAGNISSAGVLTGAGGLTKGGTGVLTLSGANTYTGATTVNNGTLLVNGSTATGSAVAVNGSSILGGNGTVGGAVTIASGATHAPGALNNGTAVENTGAYNNLGTLAIDIAGTTAGTNYDQVNVTGTVTLAQATSKLQVTVPASYTPNAGDTFTIVNNDGTDAVTSTFNNLPEGSFVASADGRVAFVVSYIGGTGNDVTLTVNANQVPTLEDGVFSAALNKPFSYPITGQDADAGDTLTYAKTGGDALPGVTVSSNGTVSGTPTASGVFNFNVTVTDNKGAFSTAKYKLTVVAREDGVGPVLTHSAIPSSLTRDQLAAMTLTGTARDVASSGVTPAGVQRVQIQLRRTSDGFAYNGTAFTASQTPFYVTTIDDPGSDTTVTRNYSRSLSFVPSDLVVGERYSFYVLARDNAVNYGGVLIPFTIVAPAAQSMAISDLSSGNRS